VLTSHYTTKALFFPLHTHTQTQHTHTHTCNFLHSSLPRPS